MPPTAPRGPPIAPVCPTFRPLATCCPHFGASRTFPSPCSSLDRRCPSRLHHFHAADGDSSWLCWDATFWFLIDLFTSGFHLTPLTKLGFPSSLSWGVSWVQEAGGWAAGWGGGGSKGHNPHPERGGRQSWLYPGRLGTVSALGHHILPPEPGVLSPRRRPQDSTLQTCESHAILLPPREISTLLPERHSPSLLRPEVAELTGQRRALESLPRIKSSSAV